MSATTKTDVLFPTTIAGSLPKPAWLAEPDRLWAPWRIVGDELSEAKDDATLVALKLQEDAGIDIVGEGEQWRQHFVHGFLEAVEGIDFEQRVENRHSQQPLQGDLSDSRRPVTATLAGSHPRGAARACPRRESSNSPCRD